MSKLRETMSKTGNITPESLAERAALRARERQQQQDAGQASTSATGPGGRAREANEGLAQMNERLEGELSTVQSALAAMRRQHKEALQAPRVITIDPRRARPWRLADRDKRAFEDPAFAALMADMKAAGQNNVPIVVRICEPFTDSGEAHYEVVNGRRRHESAMRLRGEQIPCELRAEVKELTDSEAWIEMTRENLNREDLSPIEQARSWRAALTDQLVQQVDIAQLAGVSKTMVSRYIELAELEANNPEVFAAFNDPRDIRRSWATTIKKALEADASEVKKRAAEIQQMDPRPNASTTLQLLVASVAGDDRQKPASAEHAASEVMVATTDGVVIGRREMNGSSISYRLSPDVAEKASSGLLEKLDEAIAKTIAKVIAGVGATG